MLLIQLILLLVLLMQGHSNPCKTGWTEFGENCYKHFPSALSWTDAQKTCQGTGSILAIIHTPLTNSFITANITAGTRTWIGLHDRHQPDRWEWSGTGEVLSVHSYRNWSPGEPNDGFIFSEECVEIEDATGKWNDEGCGSKRSFVCMYTRGCDPRVLRHVQNTTVNMSVLQAPGTNLAVKFDGYTGYRARNPVAITTCRVDGNWTQANFSLYEIECTQPYSLLDSLPPILTHQPVHQTTAFRIGSKISFSCRSGYGLWRNDHIECRDLSHQLSVGMWDQPPICIKAPPCPQGWTNFGLNRCLTYVHEFLTWSEAKNRCHEIGGSHETHLVSISGLHESWVVEDLSRNDTDLVWIGLHDSKTEGTWQWTDGSSVDFKNFAEGEPNNGQFFWEEENCVELDVATGKWNDEQCSSRRSFVCEHVMDFP